MSKYCSEAKNQPNLRVNIFVLLCGSVFNRYIYIAVRTNIYMTIYFFFCNNTFTYGNLIHFNT